MVYNECGCVPGRILRAADTEEFGCETFYDVELKRCRRRVIKQVPCAEGQRVRTFGQFGYIIICGTARIYAEIITEIAVQGIHTCHVAIDTELQIMPDTTAGGVYSVLIRYLSDKIRGGIHRSTVDKRRTIEITINGRADGIVAHILRAIDVEAVV